VPPNTRPLHDERTYADGESLVFVAPADPPSLPRWLTGAERGAATGAAAVALGPAPMYALYVWRNWEVLPLDVWRVLIAQALTYAVLAGALWGACVGAALTPKPVRLKRGVRALVRVQLGWLAGALACIPAGVVAAAHFGQMPTPYFGGPEILTGTMGAILVAGVRFARAEHALGMARAFVQTLAPVPVIALLLLPFALLPVATLSLELDALRPLADRIGLAPLGAVVGAALGGVAGCWMALVTLFRPLSGTTVESMNS
jgi:hypothetical protein